MKETRFRIVVVGLILAIAAVVPAMAQEVYTNEDLKDLHIPGAYTNEDLKALEPIPTQKAPVFEPAPVDLTPWIEAKSMVEAHRAALIAIRDRLQAELDYELARIEIAYSPAGDKFTGSLRTGLKSKLEPRLESLRRQIHMRNWELSRLPSH